MGLFKKNLDPTVEYRCVYTTRYHRRPRSIFQQDLRGCSESCLLSATRDQMNGAGLLMFEQMKETAVRAVKIESEGTPRFPSMVYYIDRKNERDREWDRHLSGL